jgi:xylulokinase
MKNCILALDLGTTSFKAAPVDTQNVYGSPTVVRYSLDYNGGRITCPAPVLWRTALKALRGAARTAREQGLNVLAIGISSQAQTYIALDAAGTPVQPAVLWTDGRATTEAEEAARALPDFALTSGFLRPSPLQFLPKVLYFQRQGLAAQRFLLLNEWLIYRLTGEAYGDETNQGMGGFYDIQTRSWSDDALKLSGLTLENFAQVAPAAAISVPLRPSLSRDLSIPGIPVYSCGNDQSCAAVGAGLEKAGDIFCNFGTALVVYALKNRPVVPRKADQIAGISPDIGTPASTATSSREGGSWFLLGLESECGNVLDWLANLLYPRGGVEALLRAALKTDISREDLPQFLLIGGGRLDLHSLSLGCRREHLARAALEFYADRLHELIQDVTAEKAPPYRLFAGGGISQNALWLEFMSRRCGLPLLRTSCEHPGLVGIARIVMNGRDDGTSIRISDFRGA